MEYMSCGPKKDASVMVRLPEETNTMAKKASEEAGMTPSALLRLLLEQYLSAAKTHGANMPWPPQFQYFDTEPVRDPRHGVGKESREPRALRVAAEDRGPYGTTRDRAGSGREG